LCLHLASLMFQKQKISNTNQWRETTRKCLPLLFLAFQCGTVNDEGFWLKNTNAEIRGLFSFLKKDGAFRCAQAGRTILSCIQEDSDNPVITQNRQVTDNKTWSSLDDLIRQVKQICADGNWRKEFYRQLFTNSDQQAKISSSHFVQCPQFNEPNYHSLVFDDLQLQEEIAQQLYPSCLDHQAYLGLGCTNLDASPPAKKKCKIAHNDRNFLGNEKAIVVIERSTVEELKEKLKRELEEEAQKKK
jgi:E3 SUMO-protein ligase RanBP2